MFGSTSAAVQLPSPRPSAIAMFAMAFAIKVCRSRRPGNNALGWRVVVVKKGADVGRQFTASVIASSVRLAPDVGVTDVGHLFKDQFFASCRMSFSVSRFEPDPRATHRRYATSPTAAPRRVRPRVPHPLAIDQHTTVVEYLFDRDNLTLAVGVRAHQ